jgi:hypothetical protein
VGALPENPTATTQLLPGGSAGPEQVSAEIEKPAFAGLVTRAILTAPVDRAPGAFENVNDWTEPALITTGDAPLLEGEALSDAAAPPAFEADGERSTRAAAMTEAAPSTRPRLSQPNSDTPS